MVLADKKTHTSERCHAGPLLTRSRQARVVQRRARHCGRGRRRRRGAILAARAPQSFRAKLGWTHTAGSWQWRCEGPASNAILSGRSSSGAIGLAAASIQQAGRQTRRGGSKKLRSTREAGRSSERCASPDRGRPWMSEWHRLCTSLLSSSREALFRRRRCRRGGGGGGGKGGKGRANRGTRSV
ncbi:unnamed protein product [Prorocentrum cordatum]|uniref:Uncharacterized protein n=1 Tax=Prorocentrum cordatum TaxID=2364126 RepID=A0ABN9VG21_9DINO|nr:unnamed protein product [Polarella glacialis]